MFAQRHYRKLSGRALYLAIVISFISAILAFLFILSRYYGFIGITQMTQQTNLNDLVTSSVNRVMQQDNLIAFDEFSEISLSGESEQKCTVRKRNWGVYRIAEAKAKWKNLEYSRTVLYGKKSFGEQRVGLYLADHGHYLAVAGDTYLSGTCYLPKLGARKAYIDGKSFRYNKTINGTQSASEEKLPAVSPDLLENIKSNIFQQTSGTDSIVTSSWLNNPELHNPFSSNTIRVYEEKELQLSDLEIDGNVIIQSAKKITLSNTNNFNRIIFVAPVIEVEENFKGSLQLFALDTILVHQDVRLEYPSALVAAGIERSSCYIDIETGSYIAGTILLFAEILENENVYLKINSEVNLYGEIYCGGKVEHHGKVTGSLFCDRFVLKTRQGYYENHLLDAWVHPMGLEPNFVAGMILNGQNTMTTNGIIEWLN
jgi:hypothetical protein